MPPIVLANEVVIESLEREKRRITFDAVIHCDVIFDPSMFDQLNHHLIRHLKQTPDIPLYEKLKLIVKARESCFLTNLGILFSDQKQNHFPYAKIECARFKGKTTEVFLDQATFDNDIIGAIENAMEFIKRNIKLGATIGDIYREKPLGVSLVRYSRNIN